MNTIPGEVYDYTEIRDTPKALLINVPEIGSYNFWVSKSIVAYYINASTGVAQIMIPSWCVKNVREKHEDPKQKSPQRESGGSYMSARSAANHIADFLLGAVEQEGCHFDEGFDPDFGD